MATQEVETDLLNARDKGLEALRSFADQRLGENGTKDFYATLPHLQLKTFASMGKKKRGSEATQPSERLIWPSPDYWPNSSAFYGNPAESIKTIEHNRRTTAASGTLATKISSGTQKVDQQLKKSLRSGAFKASLTQFLLQEWSGKEYASRLEKRARFVTAGDQCFRFKADDAMTDVVKT